jgi:hypothetical protein
MGLEPSPMKQSSRDRLELKVLEEIHDDLATNGPEAGFDRLKASIALFNFRGFRSKKKDQKK